MEQPTMQMPAQASQHGNAAKFAFFYLLSLVALVFMALSTGMVIFQIINKYIPDIAYIFPGAYDSGALKFAISAIIIATPIYYSMMWLINKSLFSGELRKDSEVRRWLTYFILFVSAVVIIGWLIGTLNSFLNGELTTKFILKSLTAILISAAIFFFYFYDIKREVTAGGKDKVVLIYFYASLAIVLAALIASFFIVESPAATRARKEDTAVIDKFNMIDGALNTYYYDNGKLPAKLSDLVGSKTNYYLADTDLKNPSTGIPFDFKVTGKDTYEICATFKTSGKDTKDASIYIDPRWQHDAGYQCLSQKVRTDVKGASVDGNIPPVTVPLKQ